jgi:hypothetical protein
MDSIILFILTGSTGLTGFFLFGTLSGRKCTSQIRLTAEEHLNIAYIGKINNIAVVSFEIGMRTIFVCN